MRLDTLAEGIRFKFPECGKVATVLSHGMCGSRIKFEGDERTVEIAGDEDKAGASFTVPGRPVLVSSGSEVLLWPKGSHDAAIPQAHARGKHEGRGSDTLTVSYARIPEDRRRASAGGGRRVGVADTQADSKQVRAGAVRTRRVR